MSLPEYSKTFELGRRQGEAVSAFDKASGSVVFERYIAHVYPSSAPMTYLHRGRQYFVFTATTAVPGEKSLYRLHAYALPQ